MRNAVERGWLLGLAVLALYMWLAPEHVVDGDNAEFSSLAQIGGIAHPSGYPLFLLWLRATSWLPGTPAHAAALATAIAGAATIVVLHAACRAWGARPLAATIACAVFAAAPVFMRVATEAEVFAPNALVAAAVLWLAAREGPLRGHRRAAALGLVAGLGLANHLTCIFVTPIGVLGVVRAAREASWRAVLAALAGLVVGVLPYAYAFVTPDTPVSWGAVRDLDRLVGHFTRREYGTTELVAHGSSVPLASSLGALGDTLWRSWLALPLCAGVIALGAAIAGRVGNARESRVAWAMLAVSWLIAGPIFVARFNAPPQAIGLYIAHRFHVLPTELLAIPVAVGLDVAGARLLARASALTRVVSPIAATLGFAAAAAPSIARVQSLHTAAVETGARNILRTLPDHAVVLEYSDELYYATAYLQFVRGERADLVYVAWGLMSLPWYRERVAARGMVADAGSEPASVRLVTHLLAEQRPVFVEPGFADVTRAFPSYPYGPLIRLLPRGTAPPPVDDVIAQNRAIYGAFDFSYPRPGPHDEWATITHERYAAAWTAIAGALAASGRSDDAATAAAYARALGPAP